MRIDDLKINELLEFDTEEGVVRFAGERAIIIDATANGNLRKELVGQFGLTATRAILTRFGFVQGWRMADAMQDLFQWESENDWHHACGRIHMLGGMYRLGPPPLGSLTGEGLTLVDSYEAEQHIVHLGLSDTSVCWTICGLTSGYQGEGSKTIVPAWARVKITARLVPNQDPDHISKCICRHLQKLCPPTVRMEIQMRPGAEPYLVSPTGPQAKAGLRALKLAFGCEPVLLREGGSIPIVNDFKKILRADDPIKIRELLDRLNAA